MVTSALLYHVLHFFHITIDIRNVCVFLAPLFSSMTTLVTYQLTKELKVSLLYMYMCICTPTPTPIPLHISMTCSIVLLDHHCYMYQLTCKET